MASADFSVSKRRVFRDELIGLYGVVERNLYLTKRYFLWDLAFLLWTIANTLTIVFISRGVDISATQRNELATKLLVGGVIWAFLGIIFEIVTETVAWERWEGTIEYTFMAPVSRPVHLIGMGVVPLCFEEGTSWQTLGLKGDEQVTLRGLHGDLKPRQKLIAEIVGGIAEGCRLAGCALVGGETAEHPGVMPDDHYDIAGTGVGVVEADQVLGADRVASGDVVIAMASSGVHSNGFSLVRHVLLSDEVVFTRGALDTFLAGPVKGRSAKAVATSSEADAADKDES